MVSAQMQKGKPTVLGSKHRYTNNIPSNQLTPLKMLPRGKLKKGEYM